MPVLPPPLHPSCQHTCPTLYDRVMGPLTSACHQTTTHERPCRVMLDSRGKAAVLLVPPCQDNDNRCRTGGKLEAGTPASYLKCIPYETPRRVTLGSRRRCTRTTTLEIEREKSLFMPARLQDDSGRRQGWRRCGYCTIYTSRPRRRTVFGWDTRPTGISVPSIPCPTKDNVGRRWMMAGPSASALGRQLSRIFKIAKRSTAGRE